MPEERPVYYNKHFLEDEARDLARRQVVTRSKKPLQPITPILEKANRVLKKTYRELARAAKQKRELSSAGEWLLDNFYIIQEQIVQLKEDLPPSYYRKLPRLKEGEFKGYPRIYELVEKLAAISDNIIDPDNTSTAVQSYQEIETLDLGELWAVPILIRLVLIRRLVEKSGQLLEQREVKDRVEEVIDEFLDSESDEPGYLIRKLPEMLESENADEHFLTVMAQRLQAVGLLTDTERSWFDYKFRRWNTTLEDQLRIEAQRTSRLHLSIQNAISTLREASEADWSEFVEYCSMVERILRLDPSGYYPNMDFRTRDRYRKVIEKLSEHSDNSETEVAQQALLLSERGGQDWEGPNPKRTHIGYYLVGEGYSVLAGELEYRMPLDERMQRWGSRHTGAYFSFIVLHLIFFMGMAALLTGLMQAPVWLILLSLAASFLPALDLSIVSSNRLLTLWLPPRLLPKLEITRTVPDHYRTIVVVPTLFSSPDDVREQFEALEIRALANPNKGLQFVMLSDFTDARKETMPEDDAILKAAREQVHSLNRRFKSRYGKKFYLLHRRRLWNPSENVWMGWERKRGKIEEFNRLLRSPDKETTFLSVPTDLIESNRTKPVKYVITLDSDTKLPPGSALDLIRTAAHPLNRPEIADDGEVVEKGYGIIQPRISIPPKSANKSWFAHIFSGNVGLDPYTTAVSDLYQDLFGEGIFTGKGIYDLEVFEQVLGNRFPDNTILSHDLLESTYLRCGLATDIELFDDYPSNYLNYSRRNHRWIRGDWQILHWIFPKVPGRDGEWKPNPINGLSKWKIFDNLRRSITPMSLLVMLILGWTVLPRPALIWTLAVIGILAFPIYSSFTSEIFARPRRVKWKLYLEKIRSNMKINTVQAATTFIFLPHQSFVSMDAVVRTLWRMIVSRRNLLEWTTASRMERLKNDGFLSYWRRMWVNLVWSGLSVSAVWYLNPVILLLAIPFGAVWIFAPPTAYMLGVWSPAARKKPLKKREIRELRIYARRTWHYFEQYVTEEHSWLPPDNFQEDPFIGSVARTSPTNIGLGLASTYTAYEFGYITVGTLLDRIGNTLGSMKMLDRYSGHFFNWYSTKLGEVINPRYISTVDSGNLAVSLLFVKQALNGLGDKPWPHPALLEGLQDTLEVLGEIADEYGKNSREFEETHKEINQLLEQLLQKLPDRAPSNPGEWDALLAAMLPDAERLGKIDFSTLINQLSDVEYDELTDWFRRPQELIEIQIAEIREALEHDGSLADDDSLKVRDLFELEPFSRWDARIVEMASTCNSMVMEMDFNILYYKKKDLFSIGYNIDRAALDKSTYDLLASEARLASFIAIAKGDVPPKHWFKLSRRLTSIKRNEILLSWGGTMFEYLMPLLFLTRFEETLLSNTYYNAVHWQREYGDSQGNPWGFSESGYAVLNMELHYQYRAFGAPGLGLKRGLAEDYVVAPYSSLLALMVQPRAAIDNLEQLKEDGAYGLNGFYEAVDYTPERGEADEEKTVVKMYMAHHQGMGLLALANVLKDNLVQGILHDDPLVQACELLLQERIPRGIPIKEPRPIDVELEPGEEQRVALEVDHSGREELNDSPPRAHILTNGRYSTVITHAGTGYSACNDIALTRWRPERVKDAWGFFFYIKDLENNSYWSAGYRPVNREADRYDTWFHAGKVQTARVDDWIETFVEICVSPEDNIELRKLTLTNYSDRIRRLELTSYAEVVLNEQKADEAHTAFSNLFVQTDHIPEHHALVARRRPRSAEETQMWLVHTMASEDLGSLPEPIQYETDRENFIGRGRSLDDPAAMDSGSRLSGTTGNVPDPVVSMRRVIELKPGEKRSVTFGLGMAGSREDAVSMADHYDNPYATDRIFELASIYGRVELDHIGISGDQAHYYQKLAGAMIYGNERLRAGEETLKRNRQTQSGLWSYGISGDLPILVYSIRDADHIRFVERLLKAHAFWRLKGLDVDLVIINDHPPSYIDELHDAINRRIQASLERHLLNEKGGLFVLRGEEIPAEDRVLLETVAAVNIRGKLPKLDFSTEEPADEIQPREKKHRLLQLSDLSKSTTQSEPDLLYYNSYGGFTKSGSEYVILLNVDEQGESLRYPPAPWINVIANSNFGFITSERGSDYTWSMNSRENRITPWSNDAVIDPAGEALYIRDEDHRLFWSPTPGPSPGSLQYEVRYGFGYVQHNSRTLNIDQEVTKWVPVDDPVKLVRVRLTNTDLMTRTFSVYHYLEWVLGVFREQSSRYVVTELDRTLRTIFARNRYNNEFADRVAFIASYTETEKLSESFTTDRTWFIGKNRGVTNPRALTNEADLSGRFGAGFDPCAVSQLRIRLESGESSDIYFILGETETMDLSRKLIRKYQDRDEIESSLAEVREYWTQKLDRIQISTPAHDLDILFNGWLQYQNIACRMWGRTGFYQSGGAFGFRDQLQDASAALYLDPELAREQILQHAAHQFEEGDVLHWWHPPTGRGIRSRITDDLLWLPYVTAFYTGMTGDYTILDEEAPFITARKLEEGEHEAYLTPEISSRVASLYEHCCRAIDRSLTRGEHGLPLIGTGDWNDGMDRVGEEGRGESVWLGFFISAVLSDFIPLCRRFDDEERVERYSTYKKELDSNLNREGWDGEWYRRAFYDDGTPLGSSENRECRIDSIAQAWSVISGVAPEDKARLALRSAERHLVDEEAGIIRLLTPPFDLTEKNPGYIKGYIPGVRENGGQYTHGALWLIKAYAEMGMGNLATHLIRMVTPINHSLNKDRADLYKVEPYAVAADIYGEPPLIGMGGWTWYTGSAGWMYRVIAESILGLSLSSGNTVTLKPSHSSSWKSYSIRLKELDGRTTYRIRVDNDGGLEAGKGILVGEIDGDRIPGSGESVSFQMLSDGKNHDVHLKLVEKEEVTPGK